MHPILFLKGARIGLPYLRKRDSGKRKCEVLGECRPLEKSPRGGSEGGRAFGGYGEGALEGDAGAAEGALFEETAD